MRKLALLIGIVILKTNICFTHAGNPLELNDFNKSIKPFMALQLWNTYSWNNKVEGTTPHDRFGTYFRRARFGVKGQPIDRLYYNIQLSADYLGKDQYISSKGVANTGTIKIWSAYVMYRLMINTEWFNLSSGYLLPHLSREATTTPWTMSSLDKSETSCYIRRFVTGKSNGVSPGINLGGTGSLTNKLSGQYNLSFLSNMNGGNNQGEEYSPLLLGHCFLTFGSPEQETYKYTTYDNLLTEKSFVSIGIGGSYQGKCDYFKKNTTFSSDIKINLKNFHLISEYSDMKRQIETSYRAETFLIRLGYNINWQKKGILEPSICYRAFSTDDNSPAPNLYTGEDSQIDIGLNWWIHKHHLKISAHYLNNSGKGNNFNIKVSEDTKRGDIAVIGFQVVL